MASPINTTLYQRPEAFNRVGMHVARDIDAHRVVDSAVSVPGLAELPVSGGLVRVDHRRRQDVRRDVREQRRLGANVGPNPAAALDHSHDLNFARDGSTSDLGAGQAGDVPRLSADVRFVNLNRSREVGHVFGEHLSDLMEHAPSRLVCDADLAFELLGGNAASSAGHEVDAVEPQMQRCGRLLKDRSGRRVDVMTTSGASPRLPLLHRVVSAERSHLVTLRAVRMLSVFRIPLPPKIFEARGIVAEVTNELEQRVFRLRGGAPSGIVSVFQRGDYV